MSDDGFIESNEVRFGNETKERISSKNPVQKDGF